MLLGLSRVFLKPFAEPNFWHECHGYVRSHRPSDASWRLGELFSGEEVADGHRFVAVRAQPARPEATAPSVAVVAALRAEVAGFTARALIDGA